VKPATLRFLSICALFVLLCLTVPAVARPVAVLRVAPGHIVTVRSARVRDYLSPDGKYVMRIFPQEGEGDDMVPSLTVLTRKAASRARHASDGWAAVANFAWLPGKPHTLVATLAGGGDYGGALMLWRGAGQTVTLLPGTDASDDDFSLERISADGRIITYKRYGDDAPAPADLKTAKPHTLTLPR